MVRYMIVKGHCPNCNKEFLMSICIECLEEKTFKTEEDANRYIFENVTVLIPAKDGLKCSKPALPDN